MQALQSAVDASPPEPPPAATWDMRIYASNSDLKLIPNMGALTFVGSARVPVIDMAGAGAGDFKKVNGKLSLNCDLSKHNIFFLSR